jgi:hypothetical protein
MTAQRQEDSPLRPGIALIGLLVCLLSGIGLIGAREPAKAFSNESLRVESDQRERESVLRNESDRRAKESRVRRESRRCCSAEVTAERPPEPPCQGPHERNKASSTNSNSSASSRIINARCLA